MVDPLAAASSSYPREERTPGTEPQGQGMLMLKNELVAT